MPQEPGQVEAALAGEQPVVAAPRQQVHRERGGVGELQEEHLVAGDLLDRRRVVPAGEDVEAVEAGADGRVVGLLHDPPGTAVVVDVPAPGERLVRDPYAVALREVAEPAQLVGRHVVVVDRRRPDVAADEQRVDAEPLHERELGRGPAQHAGELLLVDALGVPERLVQVEREPQPVGERADLLGALRRGHEVGLEDLDPVEARLGAGVQLADQRAAQAHGGDRRPHPASSMNRTVHKRRRVRQRPTRAD